MMLGGLRDGASHVSSQNYANCVKRLVIQSMGVPGDRVQTMKATLVIHSMGVLGDRM